jgi:hypothetical protein
MTDHPRFEPIRSAPDRAHDSYHGGRLVSSVLRLVDWWRATRKSKRAVSAAPSILSTRGCEEIPQGTSVHLRHYLQPH